MEGASSAAAVQPWLDCECASGAEPPKLPDDIQSSSTIYLSSQQCSALATMMQVAVARRAGAFFHFEKLGSACRLIVSIQDGDTFRVTFSSSPCQSMKLNNS